MQIPRDALDRDPERLVRAYADLVLRVCYTYLRSTADAEDVCQDTLVKRSCVRSRSVTPATSARGSSAWR